MKELVKSKIDEYMHDLDINNSLEDNEEINLKKEEIKSAIQKLESKFQEYGELEKILEINGVNEINFTDKFKYNPQYNTYTCPEGQVLFCMTKKADVPQRKYANYEACSKCPNKEKCTTAKNGRIITRKENEDFVEIVNSRTRRNKAKYNPIERVWGALEKHWNGSILDSLDVVYNFVQNMTWKGKQPSVRVTKDLYDTGVTVEKAIMNMYETALYRAKEIGKWFIIIEPIKCNEVLNMVIKV